MCFWSTADGEIAKVLSRKRLTAPSSLRLLARSPWTNMEVENHQFVVENGLPFGAILHFHVSSRECTLFELNLSRCVQAAKSQEKPQSVILRGLLVS